MEGQRPFSLGSSMTHHTPIQAYRLVFPDSSHVSEALWEWEDPYIQRLFWNAKTFGRTVVHCTFLHWSALTTANRRIWETHYQLRASHAPWDTWQGWRAESRTLIATVQEVYEAQYGKQHDL
jgi:hypothetical protein